MVDHLRVRAWLEIRDPLEEQLAPLGKPAVEALGLSVGQRVLDVGCGIGGTPFTLAELVGSSGRVVALDLLPAAVDVMQQDPRAADTVSVRRRADLRLRARLLRRRLFPVRHHVLS